jgi:hypothetical protein
MGAEVRSYDINLKIADGKETVESVEVILDDGALREGDGCIRRFWLTGYEERPLYLGHISKEDGQRILAAVRAMHAEHEKAGTKAPKTPSRWS